MGGLKSMDTWYKEKLAQKDRIHFTVAGYQLLGNLFSNALFDAYKAETARHTPAKTKKSSSKKK
jgi:hypothetical protein